MQFSDDEWVKIGTVTVLFSFILLRYVFSLIILQKRLIWKIN